MKKSAVIAALVAAFFTGLCLAGIAGADTEVLGYVDTETWMLTESPYIVTGNVIVNPDGVLTIEPGVVIRFDGGYSLKVEGELVARGTEAQPIRFTSNLPSPSPGDWGFILFADTSTDATYDAEGNYTGGSILEHCIVEYAGGLDVTYNGAVRALDAHPMINRSTVRHNSATGIYARGDGTFRITGCTVSDNHAPQQGWGIYDPGGGISVNGGTMVDISGNWIGANTTIRNGGGIKCHSEHGTQAVISSNTVVENSASVDGGGIYTNGYSGGSATITGNVIEGNAAQKGGGIRTYQGEATITGNLIRTNSADQGGGIFYRQSIGAISGNLILRNTAQNGGGIYTLYGDTIIDHNIVSANEALNSSPYDYCTADAGCGGGGIFCASSATIEANTIHANTAPNASAVRWYADVWTPEPAFSTNAVSANFAGAASPTASVYVGDGSSNARTCPFHGNNLLGNTATYALWNHNSEVTNIDAADTWWGTAVESEVLDTIYDGIDDGSLGLVYYLPYLTAPDSAAPISPPANLAATVSGTDVHLSWAANPEPDLAGYRVYWDSDAGFPYANTIDVGNVTSHVLQDMPQGAYITVTAYDDGVTPALAGDNPATLINENQTQGNESWFSDEFLVDQPGIVVEGGAPYCNAEDVSVSLSFRHPDGVAAYLASESETTPAETDPGWVAITPVADYADSVPFTLSSEDGPKTVHVWFKSSLGSISLPNSDEIILDTTAPAGSLGINSGDALTVDRSVTLHLYASDAEGVDAWYVSEALTPPAAESPGWTAVAPASGFSADIGFVLSEGDGVKMVYTWFQDAAGNVSPAAGDDIILDTEPPSGGLSIAGGAGAINAPVAAIDVSASDAGSGGIQMAFSNDGENFSPWEAYQAQKSWTLSAGDGSKTVYVKFKDAAGFESAPFSDDILFDTQPPVPIITLPLDGEYVTSLLALAGTAEDAFPSSGLSGVEIQVTDGSVYLRPNGTWGAEEIFFTPDGGTFSSWNHDTNAVQWVVDNRYTITARAMDFAGNMGAATAQVTYGIERDSSTISCQLSQSSLILGEFFTVAGRIDPALTEGGAFVDVIFDPPAGNTVHTSVIANAMGDFSYTVSCGDIHSEGQWTVQTTWTGDDALKPAVSAVQTLDVTHAEARVTLDASSQAIKMGDPVSVSGKFTPQPDCGGDLSGIPLTLIFTGPHETKTCSVTTNDIWGHFLLEGYEGIDSLGDWTLQTVFSGNNAYLPAGSDSLHLRVVETAGYAVVVQGRISGEEGLDSHNKTAQFVYDTLISRGLFPEDIQYFNYDFGDPTRPEIDGMPTRATIEEAITTWAAQKVNESPANFYIVLVDHGLEENFFIYPDMITSAELGSWLDLFRQQLQPAAIDQEIIAVLGFCRSGSFIDDLTEAHRVIIASAAADESSYKGPLDEDAIREGEYFVSEFFKAVSLGKPVRTCFTEAVQLTEAFTASDAADSANAPYYDDALQHPLLDDNGDGVGSNDLDDPEGDGRLSEDIFIGVSSITGNDPGDVRVVETAPTRFLAPNVSTATLWARVDDDNRLRAIWTEIKPPGYTPVDPMGSEQAELVLNKTYGILNAAEQRYQWTDLAGFEVPGTYQVFYFAKDDQTGNVSPLLETRVYKALGGNESPAEVSLLMPENAAQVQTSVLLDWTDAVDPNGDKITYTVLLSRQDPDFTDPIRIECLNQSAGVMGAGEGIEDLSTYYWKVQAIDEYGAVCQSPVRTFYTNNTNPVWPCYIRGFVSHAHSGAPISGAQVSVGTVNFQTDAFGFYIGQVAGGTYNMNATATGFDPATVTDVSLASGGSMAKSFALEPAFIAPGNVNGDHGVTLEDAILSLQIVSGVPLQSNPAVSGDVNGDARIGLAEAVYVLQELAGRR